MYFYMWLPKITPSPKSLLLNSVSIPPTVLSKLVQETSQTSTIILHNWSITDGIAFNNSYELLSYMRKILWL